MTELRQVINAFKVGIPPHLKEYLPKREELISATLTPFLENEETRRGEQPVSKRLPGREWAHARPWCARDDRSLRLDCSRSVDSEMIQCLGFPL